MEELARHQVIWQKQEGRYEVQFNRPGIVGYLGFSPDTAEWFAWLERIPSFRFHGRRGHFTARRETRKRGGVYWIAYRHIQGRLKKQYIGVPATITIVRLEEVAEDLEGIR